jgi:DNA-binding response OmpR family regulator
MKALIVDDDRVLADVVAFTLKREGFQIVQAHDGEAALQRWAEEQPDLIVLDVNMPKLDGFAVCRRIRAQSDIPILLLTVRGEEDDIIKGLELGADDYITKPFSPRQLVARAQAVLRRAGKAAAATVREAGTLRLDLSRREVQVAQAGTVPLTPLETRLLDLLIVNVGQVVTTDAIIDHAWGPEGADRDMVRQLVHRLRTKIAEACTIAGAAAPELGATDEPGVQGPIYIETIPGLGYGLVVDAPAKQ